MKANGIRTLIIRGVLLVLLSLYFLVVFGQKSPNIISFNASRKAENISLQWLLAPSNNLSSVIIEKKSAGNSFKPIAEFWVNFEGNTDRNFKFTDKKVKTKKTQYRLKLVTDKGEVQYSEIILSSMTTAQRSTAKPGEEKAISQSVLTMRDQTELNENLKTVLILRLQERDVNYL